MRRILAGFIAFLVLTATLLTLPVYAAPLPAPKPVAPSIDDVALGSVAKPADEAIVSTDGHLVAAGEGADVVPAAEGDGPVAQQEGPAVQTDAPGTAIDVPSSGAEEPGVPVLTTSQPKTDEFSAVGVTWARDASVADVSVSIRVKAVDGDWGEWTHLARDDAEQSGPDSDVRDGTAPYYTGPATGVEVVVQAPDGTTPRDVRTQLIDPGTSSADDALGTPAVQDKANAAVSMPTIYSRAQWGADESIRTWDPTYAPSIKAATIHHTADSNDYTADQVPEIMRSIYAYHTISRGWGDIGYNVVVDKFGRAWEGRYSGSRGISSPVIGAHAGGFNTSTFGVSMLGDYDVAPTTPAMISTVAQLVAWKLSLYGVDPQGTTSLVSAGGGTSKYAAGTTVVLPTVFGHRDVGNTVCPGAYGYAQLGQIRAQASAAIAFASAHDPRGVIDSLKTTATGVTATGWAYDPDAPTTPVTVRLRVDGSFVSSTVANTSRPDVGAAFGVGSAHGYTASATLREGDHDVCVVADNLGADGSQSLMACRDVTFANQEPEYSLDRFAENADGTVSVAGWAYDGDGSAVEVHVYDNGAGRAYPTGQSRPDVQAVHPAAGADSGFDITVGPLSGSHQICVFVIDTVASGNNRMVGCRQFGYQAPLASVDVVAETATGSLRVAGWAIDPSVPGLSIPVHVYVDGRGTAFSADRSRPDVASVVQGAGSAHGYDVDIPAAVGTHQVCVFAINQGVVGANVLVRCASVSLRYQAPVGSVDVIAGSSGRVDVAGWTYDPSVPTESLTVHYYVDGRAVASGVADLARADIARAFPGVGQRHGFERSLTVASGSHQVCVFAINQGVAGPNTLMRCQQVAT